MIKLGASPKGAPAWLAARFGDSTPPEGKPSLNQNLPANGGQTTTDPVKTTHSIFNYGVQGAFK